MRALKHPDPLSDQVNEEKDIEAQLHSTLRQEVARKLQCRRPLLTHLNADTTWLLSLPVPEDAQHAKSKKRKRKIDADSDLGEVNTVPGTREAAHQKAYFHILIDPWLKGGQSDVAQFFSQQWHAHESAVQTIAEVEEVIGDIEDLASSRGALSSPNEDQGLPKTAIDAVVVSHEFTDHMHKETLLEVPDSVPVFAASKAAGIIRSWRHFDVVVTLPTSLTVKNRDWRITSVEPLPPWVGISRLGQDKIDLLYYHSAVMFAYCDAGEDGNGEIDEAEAIIYTPHGIAPEDLMPLATAEPPIRTLALLHGLHDIRLGPRLNLGAHNGLKVNKLTHAKYWIGTHDEVKRGGGLVSWFLKRRVYTVNEAIEKEIQENGDVDESLTNVYFAELGNGESLILE